MGHVGSRCIIAGAIARYWVMCFFQMFSPFYHFERNLLGFRSPLSLFEFNECHMYMHVRLAYIASVSLYILTHIQASKFKIDLLNSGEFHGFNFVMRL